MTTLLGVSLVARTAITADVLALTVIVALSLHRGYAAAGAVAAVLTVGLALGGPLLGRLIDARGLRAVVLVTTVAQAAFWVSVPVLPYAILLLAAFPAGLLMVPVQSLTRQAITAMTSPGQRRAAFALESVQGELSYLAGPAIVVLGAASISPAVVAWGIGAAITAGGIGLALLDPPLRAAGEPRAGESRAGRWLSRRMLAVLVLAAGTTALLSGVDLAIVAVLRQAGQLSWAAVVVAVSGAASVLGGLVYGAQSRSLPAWLLLGVLGVVTTSAGLAGNWPWLCVTLAGAGLLIAPTLSTLADAVSRLAPAAVRGEATGWLSAAQSAGFAFGAPLAGLSVDTVTPAAGFVAAGVAGLAAALAGGLLAKRAQVPQNV